MQELEGMDCWFVLSRENSDLTPGQERHYRTEGLEEDAGGTFNSNS
jgi:hypothetical protein